jgi:hypothetical protein
MLDAYNDRIGQSGAANLGTFLRTRNVACLRVMQALQASVPTALDRSGTSGGL